MTFTAATFKVIYIRTRERAFVNQMNIGTVSKTMLGKPLRDQVERIWVFPST